MMNIDVDTDNELIQNLDNLSKDVDIKLRKRIFKLVDLYEKKKEQVQNLQQQNDFFIKQWDKRNIRAHEKEKQQDKMLEQQSRLASMGEMIDAIAHQWKQPLNAISMLSDMLRNDFADGTIDIDYVENYNSMVHGQIEHMVSTLNEFRTFFRPSTKNEEFYIIDVVRSVQVLMKDELISQNTVLNVDVDETIKTFGNKNEYKHLLLNFFNNAIDAFNERVLSNRNIYVRCYEDDDHIFIEVEDNAGGIPDNVIENIFKANYTTKPVGKGTGIGLYMSEQIAKKNHGIIKVQNTDIGALFTVIIKKPQH